jgi:Skp family chaperone for outer membrane proteins
MRVKLTAIILAAVALFSNQTTNAQTFKAGVFDIDLMVQAMPGYRAVDSLVMLYESDSLGVEYDYNQMEFSRLDSTYRADSAAVAAGKKPKMFLDKVAEDRRNMGLNIVYWKQIAQNKSQIKRNQLAQPLYEQVSAAYRKILLKKKYTIILKPNTYEAGFAIDNIFISMARELKLSSLPQELIYLGDDPDAVKPPAKAPAQKPVK